MAKQLPTTLGELKASGYRVVSVKEEMRRNLVKKLRKKESVFPGILGYDDTVVPQIQAAILAKHDFLLLGLRGQAKTRLVRSLVNLLDEFVPVVEGSPINDDPFQPVSKYAKNLIDSLGDEAPIGWLGRDQRYREKLATPDVTISDLIGDIDPIKAMNKKLDFSDEEVIHYGIIPRSNRCIFAINELPDLAPRIQVGLLNIMEEKDVQIRGFAVRLPMDVCMVYTANPEDYTNRGNIITPLKDRIDAQIITHYPVNLNEAISITRQEAWTDRTDGEDGPQVVIPELFREIVERTAFEARRSEYVDRNSGVSARMSITFLETVAANAERRGVLTGADAECVRIGDVFAALTAITGKVELVYKGEQEGPAEVAAYLVGRGVKDAFNARFVPNYRPGRDQKFGFPEFAPVVNWFEEENRTLELSDELAFADYLSALKAVDGLESLARVKFHPMDDFELAAYMEFIVEGLHQNFMITKTHVKGKSVYTDTVSHMMGQMDEEPF